MRVLLVDSDDDAANARWASGEWDRVVDLAATSNSGIVESVSKLETSEFGRIREALAFGSGAIIDSYGIDWWDLLSIEFHEYLEKLQVLRRLASTIGSSDQVFATRPGFELRLLQMILGREVCYPWRSRTLKKTVPERAQRFFKFKPEQVVEILGDKYDSGNRLRRLFSRARPQFAGEVVLAPSSYVNVSRGAAAYASAIPESDFLLVATRASGMMKDLPRNMRSAWLTSYALPTDHAEIASVLAAWKPLERRLAAHEDWTILARLGVLNGVPSLLRNGILVRDAWVNVFESAKVRAVLCGDEMNPFTRLPVCIAKQRGIAAFAFHHGALDGRYRYRDNCADLLLAKSQMEVDYLLNQCGVAEEKIVLVPFEKHRELGTASGKPKTAIVFFSEPYEVVGGRCRDVYRQVLPRLSRLAREQGCQLVLKLHPQESRRERGRIASAAIETGDFRIVDGPLVSDLLDQIQIAVTVSSTSADDCSQRDIPAFVCSWLDRSHYKYAEQFVKFGAAIPLRSPEEIEAIPGLVGSRVPARQEAPGNPDMHRLQLRQLLDGAGAQAKAAGSKVVEPAWA